MLWLPLMAARESSFGPDRRESSKKKNNLENAFLFVFSGGIPSWEHESEIRRVLLAVDQD